MIRNIFACFMLVFLAGCVTAPRVMPPTISQTTLQGLCRKYNIDCHWDGISQTVNMVYGGKTIRALVGSRIVMINDNRISLGDVLRRHRGAILVPEDFERVVMGPAAAPQEDYQRGAATGKFKKIVIDAGHGGKDPGAIGYHGVKEMRVVLDIAQRVAKDFEAAGVKVILTRDTDEFITLPGRTEIASQVGVDLFLSIHANAHKSRRSRGIEVYYAAPLVLADKMDPQRRENEKRLTKTLNMRPENDEVRGIIADMLYSHRVGISPGLAAAVQRGMSRETGAEMRGSKPQRFFVLRNTLIPAVLVEVGFLTNPQEAGLLQDKAYRQRIADAITKSVLRYMNEPR